MEKTTQKVINNLKEKIIEKRTLLNNARTIYGYRNAIKTVIDEKLGETSEDEELLFEIE